MIDIKILSKKKGSSQTSGSSSGLSGYSATTVKEASHAAKADLATEAEGLTKDSSAWTTITGKISTAITTAIAALAEVYLSKTDDDTAAGQITFQKGLLLGDGTHGIDADGKATLQDLVSEAFEEGVKGLGIWESDGKYYVEADAGKFRDMVEAVAGKFTSLSGQDDSPLRILSELVVNKAATFVSKVTADMLQSSDYSSGASGFIVKKDTATGKSFVEVDELLVRVKAVFEELEVRKLSYSGGNICFSSAGSTIERVENITDSNGDIIAFKCYLKTDDGTTKTRNWWKVGDMAKCQQFNVEGSYTSTYTLIKDYLGRLVRDSRGLLAKIVKSFTEAGNRYYWRAVVAVGGDYIVLSNEQTITYGDESVLGLQGMDNVFDDIETGTSEEEDYEGQESKGHALSNDTPLKGDDIVQMGSLIDQDRQSCVMIKVTGTEAPAICEYLGIDDYTLAGHLGTRIAPRTGTVMVAKKFILRTSDNGTFQVPIDMGEWSSSTAYPYYARVSHNGSLWICDGIAEDATTTVEPGTGSVWSEQVKKGADGKDGTNGKDGTSVEIKGTAIAYYGTFAELQDAATKTGLYLCDENVSGSSGDSFLITYDGSTFTDDSASVGDCYVSDADGDFYMAIKDADGIYHWKNCGQFRGDDGADGVSVVINPSAIILTQHTETKEIAYTSNTATITVYEGTAESSAWSIKGVTVSKTNSAADFVCTYSGLTLTVTDVNMTTRPTSAYADVTLTDGTLVMTVRLSVAVNWLGTFQQVIEADVLKQVASQLYSVLDKDGNVTTTMTIADYIKSASKNTATISETVTTQGSTLSALQTKVTKNTTAISQNATDITALATRVTDNETAITEVEQTADGLDVRVSKITTGGKNLITGTADFSGLTHSMFVESTALDFDSRLYAAYKGVREVTTNVNLCYTAGYDHNPKAGEFWTFSFWAKADVESSFHAYFFQATQTDKITLYAASSGSVGTTSTDGDAALTVGTSWTRYFVTWQIPDDYADDAAGRRALIRYFSSGATKVYLAGLKLERSSVPSDWSESVEDTEAKIEVASNKISATVTDGLKTAGVDITAGEIVLQADTTKIVDSDGNEQALISNGKIQAKYVDADSMTVGSLYTKGNVLISISNGSFKVYGATGDLNINLGLDESGEAVLQFLREGVVTWQAGNNGMRNMQEKVASAFQAVTYYTLEMASIDVWYDTIPRKNTYDTKTFYVFREGYTMSGTARIYDLSGTNSPSEWDGKIFTETCDTISAENLAKLTLATGTKDYGAFTGLALTSGLVTEMGVSGGYSIYYVPIVGIQEGSIVYVTGYHFALTDKANDYGVVWDTVNGARVYNNEEDITNYPYLWSYYEDYEKDE